MVDVRFCRRCQTEKPVSEFGYRSGNRSHQVKSWCYKCTRAYYNDAMRNRYKNSSPEERAKVCADNKIRHLKNPSHRLLTTAKKRAAKRHLAFSIELKDIVIPDLCPLLNIPLRVASGRVNGNSPTLDRIRNDRGYTPDNIWVISYRANTLKMDATIEELETLVANLRLRMTPQRG